MSGGAVIPTPDQSPRERFQAVFDQVLAAHEASGIDPAEALTTLAVTGRSDDEVNLIRELAQTNGFRNIVLVDDSVPPRPGTVHSSTLNSMQSATLAEARAHRILTERES
ncbi:hypothetical protein [Mycobacteroides chelonae]|uniref:hypothetical protein n=1 Tax=Mycobacteroides chelonae TaxID=1774 RepID=UPI00104255F7|nr:hypothetical protein [Mycobacteroides chelonae]